MNSAGHRVARVGAQYARGVDLRPAVVEIRACYGLQSYDIKTEWQGKSISCCCWFRVMRFAFCETPPPPPAS